MGGYVLYFKRLKVHIKKKNKNNKLSKQAEQEENHRYGDHLEGYQLIG